MYPRLAGRPLAGRCKSHLSRGKSALLRARRRRISGVAGLHGKLSCRIGPQKHTAEVARLVRVKW